RPRRAHLPHRQSDVLWGGLSKRSGDARRIGPRDRRAQERLAGNVLYGAPAGARSRQEPQENRRRSDGGRSRGEGREQSSPGRGIRGPALSPPRRSRAETGDGGSGARRAESAEEVTTGSRSAGALAI